MLGSARAGRRESTELSVLSTCDKHERPREETGTRDERLRARQGASASVRQEKDPSSRVKRQRGVRQALKDDYGQSLLKPFGALSAIRRSHGAHHQKAEKGERDARWCGGGRDEEARVSRNDEKHGSDQSEGVTVGRAHKGEARPRHLYQHQSEGGSRQPTAAGSA